MTAGGFSLTRSVCVSLVAEGEAEKVASWNHESHDLAASSGLVPSPRPNKAKRMANQRRAFVGINKGTEQRRERAKGECMVGKVQ